MGWDTINIGLSGLQAAQTALNVTGNNITNASVPGYSRQEIVQTQATTATLSSSGTSIVGIQRVYDSTLAQQARQIQASQSGAQAYSTQIGQMNTLLTDSTSGLGTALQKFQSSLQSLSASPADTSIRQAAMSSATTLANTTSTLSTQLDQINSNVNNQLQSSVDNVNSLAKQIALVNVAITHASGNASNPPNALLDQRDQLLSTLSQQCGINVNTETNGLMLDISTSNGTPLVIGNTTNPLSISLVQSPSLAAQSQAMIQSGSTIIADSSFGGNGTIGGLLQFRDEALNQTQTALGQISTQFSSDFNTQNALGQDANGNQGGGIFKVNGNTLQLATTDPKQLAAAMPIVSGATSTNTGSSTITQGTVSIASLAIPAATPITLTYNSGTNDFSIANDPSGAVNTGAYVSGNNLTVNGYTFAISGIPANGDTFTLNANINGVNDGRNAIALTKLQTTTSNAASITTTTSSSNTGAGVIAINATGVDPAYSGVPLQQGQAVQFTYNANNSTLTTKSANGMQQSIPFVSGGIINYNGLSVTITGTPNNGDSFTASPNIMANKNYSNGFLSLVNMSGTKVSINASNLTAQNSLLVNISNQQQSVSGVNLDEEAANLIQRQSEYQACAKVISSAQTCLDNLFAIMH